MYRLAHNSSRLAVLGVIQNDRVFKRLILPGVGRTRVNEAIIDLNGQDEQNLQRRPPVRAPAQTFGLVSNTLTRQGWQMPESDSKCQEAATSETGRDETEKSSSHDAA